MKTVDAALGKWPSILSMMGISPEFLTGKHTACPACQAGKDRFRFANTEGRGEFFCSTCGHGDGFDLIQKIMNWDFRKTAQEVEKLVGVAKKVDIKPQESTDQKRFRLNNLSRRVKPLNQSKSVMDYLRSRGISDDTLSQANLSVIRGYEYYEGGSIGGRYDVLVGKVMQCGRPITYHLTYTDKGIKADVRAARKVLPPVVKFTHGAIELFKHEGKLGVAEGIETALSTYQQFQTPTWSCLKSNSLQNFVIPEGVNHLLIFADNDQNRVGQKAAETLKGKADYQGVKCDILTPSQIGQDWNDVLLAGND